MRSLVFSVLLLASCSSEKPAPEPKPVPTPATVTPGWTIDDFSKLSGELDIQLDEPTEAVGNLQNQKARPTATIKSVKLEASVFENNDLRPLTAAELAHVIFRHPQIRLRSLAGEVITHAAPNGQHFTVRDLLAAIEDHERQTRGKTDWLGGIDAHHIFFEGLERWSDGIWIINWGS